MLFVGQVDQRTLQQDNARRCVGAEDGEKMAREHSAIFMETSSKEGHNILDSLVLLAREMCSSEDVEVQSSTLLIRSGLTWSPNWTKSELSFGRNGTSS